MRHFTYTAFLPSIKKSVLLKELTFDQYKHLIKCITNDNDIIVADFIDDLLMDLCFSESDIKSYTFLDKLIILLTIRSVCVSPELELTVTCPVTGNTFNSKVMISDIIQTLQAIVLPDDLYGITKEYNNGNLTVELGMPSTLNLQEQDNSIINTIVRTIILNNNNVTDLKDSIIEHLPAAVLQDIKAYLLLYSKTFNNMNLLSIQTPFAENKTVNIPLNFFSNSIIEFIKICFKRSLLSIYEMEYFLINRLHLDYQLIKSSTPVELNIYINFYKDELQAEEKQRKTKQSLNPLHP